MRQYMPAVLLSKRTELYIEMWTSRRERDLDKQKSEMWTSRWACLRAYCQPPRTPVRWSSSTLTLDTKSSTSTPHQLHSHFRCLYQSARRPMAKSTSSNRFFTFYFLRILTLRNPRNLLSAHTEGIPGPDPRLLRFHRPCCLMLNMGGAGEYVKQLTNMEDQLCKGELATDESIDFAGLCTLRRPGGCLAKGC